MRLLLDANLSPTLAEPLTQVGHETLHVAALALSTASDDLIFDRALQTAGLWSRPTVTFRCCWVCAGLQVRRVVLLRHVNDLPPRAQAALLVANLPTVALDLERGAIVSLSPGRLAVRDLPIRGQAFCRSKARNSRRRQKGGGASRVRLTSTLASPRYK